MNEAAAQKSGTREEISLDGEWRFRHEAGDWRTANVPAPWQAEFDDLRNASGRATYVRTFAVPAGWTGRDIVLRFGAVNYLAEVSLNGTPLGRHEGGYLPFEFVLPPAALKPQNELTVSVVLPTGDASAYPDHPFGEIPHGKQSWYGPLGGIWQSVTLVARHARALGHCAIAADARSGKVAVQLDFPAAASGAAVEVTAFGPSATPAGSARGTVSGTTLGLDLTVADPALWSPDLPNLYTLEVAVTAGAVVVDCTRHVFGFRTIETRDGKFYLNGAPLYLRGALDQDYYPEGICTPPSLEFLEDQARKTKALGLNLLRCHIKVPDPRYYEVADRLGLLIWTEIPNVGTFTARSADRLRTTMEGILHRDGNHPSIIAWTLINEDWGTRLVENADHRNWLAETFDWLKAKDPSRLVVDNSACIPNFHVRTDINDYHYYRSVPERRAEWDQLTKEFAARADWTFSPHGDYKMRGDEPLVVSEFGVWGLPDPKGVLTKDGTEPWWFQTGIGWGDGAAYPHGIEARFRAHHLDRVFGTFDEFIARIQNYQFQNLKYEIESMRAAASIQGYVITELTDVHWEANGLMDLNRNPRQFAKRFAEVNTDIVIVPEFPHYAGYAGASLPMTLKLATGGRELPAGATLSWTLDGAPAGSLRLAAAPGLTVVELGAQPLTLPQVDKGAMLTVAFRIEANGTELARNSTDIAVYSPRAKSSRTKVAAADRDLGKYLGGLGYDVVDPAAADVIVVHALDAKDIEAMRGGARYLVLADGSVKTNGNLRTDPGRREPPTMPDTPDRAQHLGAESQLPNIALHARDGTLWRGDWIATFGWLKRDGAFAAIPGGPMLDLSFDRVVPHHVMTGFRAWEFDGLIPAGLVIGWIHKAAATIALRRVGRGGLVATTFRLTGDPAGADPVAAALFDGLLSTAAQFENERPT